MILDVKLSTDQTFNVQLRNGCSVIGTPINPSTPSTPSGKDGLSAYEIALKNGFKGSETEWLASLVGPQGPAGPAGPQGIQGEPGKNGTDGYSPIRGTDYWTPEDIAEIKGYVDEAILGGAW